VNPGSRGPGSVLATLIAFATLLAPLPAAATKLIARYTFNEASGPVRNDSVGTNTSASEVGDTGFLYDTASVPGGDYGLLTVGDSQLGVTGGLSGGDGAWVTGTDNELGKLTNDFTVMAWVNIDNVNVRQRIIGRLYTGLGGWSFGIDGGGTLLLTRFGVNDVGTIDPTVSSGTWTHVAVTKSSITGITFFQNGSELENFPAETGNWLESTDPWVLGSLNVFGLPPAEHLSGLLDDIRVYDGALDAQGIREALETSGTLIANYTFGEPAGPKRYDFAGTPTDASGSSASFVYGAPPIPAGTYGSVTIAGNTFGANGGTSSPGAQWLTQANNELGTLTDDFTVMAWVNLNNSTISRQRIIGRTGSGTGGWSFGIEEGALTHAFIFTGYGVIDAVSADAPIQPLVWQHLAATKSSKAGVSFYRNGILIQQDSGFDAPWLPSSDAWSLLGSTEPFDGKVDEVRVYQGVLDTQSIRDAASGLSCRNPNLAVGPGGGSPNDALVLTDQDLIEDLNVTVDLSYPRVGNVSVILKHLETGTQAILIQTPGGGSCNGRDILVTLDDSAASFASDQCAATRPSIKGTFKPSQALSKFFREPLAGTWQLRIDDAEGNTPGNLFRWCLQAQKASVPNRIFADAFE
jgi:subtilisin-like proprotein convertase family protein